MERQIADLHCHYPMHLLADENGGDPFVRPLRKIKKRRPWNKIRAILVRWAAQRLNFGSKGEWLVNLEELDRGGVRLVFSVLYVPETELGIEEWLSGRPEERSFDELLEHMDEVEKDLLLAVELRGDDHLGPCGTLFPSDRREGVGNVGQHVEQIALFRINDLLHLGQLLTAKALLGETLQEPLPSLGRAPQSP